MKRRLPRSSLETLCQSLVTPMFTYRHRLRPANRGARRPAGRRRQRALWHHRQRPLLRWLTATRDNPLRDLCSIVGKIIQSHYRLFPQDAPRSKAQRRKAEEQRAWARAHSRRFEEDLQRIYGDPKSENGQVSVKSR